MANAPNLEGGKVTQPLQSPITSVTSATLVHPPAPPHTHTHTHSVNTYPTFFCTLPDSAVPAFQCDPEYPPPAPSPPLTQCPYGFPKDSQVQLVFVCKVCMILEMLT